MSDEATRLARMEATLELVREQLSALVGSIAVVTQVQLEHQHTRDGLSRAYVRIEALETALKKHESEERDLHGKCTESVRMLESRVNRYVWLGSGILFGVSSAMSAVAWVINNNIVGALQAVAKATGH